MKRQLVLGMLLVCLPVFGAWQLPDVAAPIDGRGLAMGGVRSLSPALHNRELALHYQMPYLLQTLSIRGISIHFPILGLKMETGLFQSGDKSWKENAIRILLSRNLAKRCQLRVGLCRYGFRTAESYRGSSLFCEIRLHYQLTGHLEAGLLLVNPTGSEVLAENQKNELTRNVRLGMGFHPTGDFCLLGELDLNAGLLPRFRIGSEYRLCEEMKLRLGCLTLPLQPTFGVGGFTAKFHYDLAGSWHPVLGMTSGISISYTW